MENKRVSYRCISISFFFLIIFRQEFDKVDIKIEKAGEGV